MPKRHYISLSTLVILCYILIRVSFLFQKWDKPGTEATLSWDVFGYYLYLPASLIYDDLGGLGFVDEIISTYHPSGSFYHAVEQADGQHVMKYPVGMALIYLPLFLLGHLGAFLSNFPMDGFSWPYQFAISMGCICYAFLGLWVMRNVLLRYFSDLSVAIVLTVLVLCTNYLNYVSIDGAMPHNSLFTIYALIIYCTVCWHERPNFRDAIFIGLLVGLATITRPTELIAILIPLLWGIKNREDIIERWRLILQNWQQVLVLTICLIAIGSIQLIYWKTYSGHFLYYSYEEQGFSWLKPHLIDGIISARKGWLMYTPVMIFALIGFWTLYRKYRSFFWSCLIYFVINIYIVFSWDVWWYGGGFGARALIPSYAILLFPLAAFIAYIFEERKLYLKIGIPILFFLCMELNMVMTWQAHAPGQILHPEYMTKAYYWKIFGDTTPKKSDKKFLDVRHELGSTEGMTITPLYRNDYETDTSKNVVTNHVYAGNKAMAIYAHQSTTPFEISLTELPPTSRKSWVRVSARVFYTDIEWDEYAMGQMIVQFIREGDGRAYRGTYVKIQRLFDPWQWYHLEFEMKFPWTVKPTDRMQIYLSNQWGQRNLYLDDLKVDLIQP